jgi:hypothetical protein
MTVSSPLGSKVLAAELSFNFTVTLIEASPPGFSGNTFTFPGGFSVIPPDPSRSQQAVPISSFRLTTPDPLGGVTFRESDVARFPGTPQQIFPNSALFLNGQLIGLSAQFTHSDPADPEKDGNLAFLTGFGRLPFIGGGFYPEFTPYANTVQLISSLGPIDRPADVLTGFYEVPGTGVIGAPEPTTLLLLASGCVGLVTWRRKQVRTAAAQTPVV